MTGLIELPAAGQPSAGTARNRGAAGCPEGKVLFAGDDLACDVIAPMAHGDTAYETLHSVIPAE